MPLTPGDQLGPYAILALIGRGGMGEVYKAHDPRLRRDVAIKVSHDQFTERFTREARAIASLNHTNVCHLYDVGPNYLVMEFVEGEPLKGPLPLETAIEYAGQILEALGDGLATIPAMVEKIATPKSETVWPATPHRHSSRAARSELH